MSAARWGRRSADGDVTRVLTALEAAHQAGDDTRFRTLCERYAVVLDARREEWLRAPQNVADAFRQSPEQVRPYLQMILRVAQELDALGHPESLRRLAGAERPGSPQEKVHEAQLLEEDGEHEACEALLRDVLDEFTGDSGWTSDIHVRLSDCAARRNDLDTAIAHARQAHAFAQHAGGRRVADTTVSLEVLLAARELRLGTPDGKRLGACRETVTRAQKLSDRARFAESNRLLRELLTQASTWPSDAAAQRHIGKIYGLMGLNHFYAGDRDEARAWTEKALHECRRCGDSVGAEVYRANLEEIGRTGPAPAARRG
ncbi:hypothetical protein [Streptomyces sp. NPDC050485]|uniref:hypothetical protein n=1 Tax=Streptomyces sp. NPDC050485 TaxID=3365617 RepID=UPI0037A58C91